MSGLTKLGLALIPMLGFFLLALAAELVYVLFYLRISRRPGDGDPELAGAGKSPASPTSRGLLLCIFRRKNRSRVEPTSVVVNPLYSGDSAKPPAPPPAGEKEMEKLQEMYAYRALFTIREEEEEEEKEVLESDDRGRSVSGGRGTAAAEDGEVVEATFSFSTAGLSPPFYTPPPSPPWPPEADSSEEERRPPSEEKPPIPSGGH